jgi:hypothetical protein
MVSDEVVRIRGMVGWPYRWYVLLRHSRQPWSSSWSGVRPLSEACVATGMKMGRGTGPWGRWSVAARALVTCHTE